MIEVQEERIRILNIGIHNLTRDKALDYIEQMAQSDHPYLICTPNVDYIVKAQRDEELKNIINTTDLTIADGMGVVYASHLLGTPLKMNVSGRLTVPEMCKMAEKKGLKVFLLGGKPGVADRAKDKLEQSFPKLMISGVHNGYFTADEELGVIEKVKLSNCDILFLALGTPKQEKWMVKHQFLLNVPVTIGVGSSLDRISGDFRSPPKWMTDIGIEWFFRIFQDPIRLGKRYLIEDPIFFVWIIKERLNRLIGFNNHEK